MDYKEQQLQYEARRKKIAIGIVLTIAVSVALFIMFNPFKHNKAPKWKEPATTTTTIDYIKKTEAKNIQLGGGYIYNTKAYNEDEPTKGYQRLIMTPKEKQAEDTSQEAQDYKASFQSALPNLFVGQVVMFVRDPSKVTMEVYKSARPNSTYVVIFFYNGEAFGYATQYKHENGNTETQGDMTDVYRNRVKDKDRESQFFEEQRKNVSEDGKLSNLQPANPTPAPKTETPSPTIETSTQTETGETPIENGDKVQIPE